MRRGRLRCLKELRDEGKKRKSRRPRNRTKYAYDTAGNTTGYSTVTASYNNAGRLKALANSSSTETVLYNAFGQRIEVSGGVNGTVLYAYDEAGHLLGEYDGTGALIEETVWLGDIPVATLRPSGATVAIYYVHSDQLNTPREVTRPSDNTALWTWNSDPFGTDAANPNPAGVGLFAYNLRFPGQVFDGQAGLHYNYSREYDPAAGTYVESDPIGLAGGSYSTSAYANANPLSRIDPSGKFYVSPGFVAGWGAETAGAAAGPFGALIAAFGVGYEIGSFVYNGVGVPLQEALQVPYNPNATGGGHHKPPPAPPSTTGGCPPEEPRKFSRNKSPQKWANQMRQRGWTLQQIEEAIQNGQQFPEPNNLNPANGATRYVSPETGQSVVVDNVTGEVIHVGGPGFKY